MPTILCYGDSNTYGYIPGGGGRYPYGSRYPGILGGLLGEGYRIAEDGLVGRTTVFEDPCRDGRRGLDQVAAAVRAHLPDYMILMLGTNDCKRYFTAEPEKIAGGMLALARAAKSAHEGLEVVLVSPVVIIEKALSGGDYDGASLKTSRLLSAAYRRAADSHGFLFLDAAASAEAAEADGEHLTEEGHRALAGALAGLIARHNSLRREPDFKTGCAGL